MPESFLLEDQAAPRRRPLWTAASVQGAEAQLAQHPVYGAIRDLQGLRRFTERHVICVLDFMSLLKSLEHDLVPRSMPWTPVPDPGAARFIHEIVLDEESEQLPDGRVLSHFEWYLEAMDELGADTAPIRELVAELALGAPALQSLERSRLPEESKAFGAVTFGFLQAPAHVRAAVFFHGRENVIPAMFLPLAQQLREKGVACESLLAYLERHVELDGKDHGPRAAALMDGLFEGRHARRREAMVAAGRALEARRDLWDATLAACSS